MEYEIRNIAGEELEAYSRQLARTFGHDYNPDHLELRRLLFEFDRNLATVDRGQIVGTAGIYSFEMNVPGGATLPCAGVTMVTVRSTHRRQGVVRGMMRKQLQDVRDKGEPLAALWASESSIYGRFGYGLSIQSMELTIRREWAKLRSEAPAPGVVRLVTAEEAKTTWPDCWARAGKQWPGWVSRSPEWWDLRIFHDPKDWRDGFTANYYAQYEDPEGQVRGIARYRIKQHWDDGLPNGTLRVEELAAETAEAYAGLWRYLTGVDLIGEITWETASVDEPLFWMLEDSRRLGRKSFDSIWLRLVDIEAALAARAYSVEGQLVLGVRDSFLPWCEGTYELEGGPAGATCRRTNASPAITLSAADLATIFLGGARLATLAKAGRVEGDHAAFRRADLMFSWDQPPYCAEHF